MLRKLAPLAIAFTLLGSLGAAASVTYTYDNLGRLKKAAYSNNKEIDYTYDQAGNRTIVVTQTTTPHFAAAAHPTAKHKKAHRRVRKTRKVQ